MHSRRSVWRRGSQRRKDGLERRGGAVEGAERTHRGRRRGGARGAARRARVRGSRWERGGPVAEPTKGRGADAAPRASPTAARSARILVLILKEPPHSTYLRFPRVLDSADDVLHPRTQKYSSFARDQKLLKKCAYIL